MDLWESVANAPDAGWVGKTVSAVLGALCGGGASAYFCRLILNKTIPDLTLAYRNDAAAQRLADKKESEENRRLFRDESKLGREQTARILEIGRHDMQILWRDFKEESALQNNRIAELTEHLGRTAMHLEQIHNHGCGGFTKKHEAP